MVAKPNMRLSFVFLYSKVILTAVAGVRIDYRGVGRRCLFAFPTAHRQPRHIRDANVVICRRISGDSRPSCEETDGLRATAKPVETEQNENITTSVTSGVRIGFKLKSVTNFGKVASRGVRRVVGSIFSTAGLLTSAGVALVTDKDHFRRLKPTVKSLQHFLETSGIALELKQSLNRRLFQNLVILARVQQESMNGADRRNFAAFPADEVPAIPSFEESLRYMKYATAVYGSEMIKAAEIDARGIYDGLLYPLSTKRISEHIGVPEEDIVLSNVDYGAGHYTLRHFVAIDHENRKVVLSVRGTFTVSEMVDDLAGFSRPFCGGEAHSEMANKAEKVWEIAGATVLDMLQRHEEYELVITGHSLGAGTACLLHIMCHENDRSLVKGRQVRCFAYSSPPVFSPLEAASSAIHSATNFIHENDSVPFLSVDSIRHLFSCLQAVEKEANDMSFSDRIQLVNGYAKPSQSLIDAVETAQNERLPIKPGAPLMLIPAASTVWMRERHKSGKYNVKVCDPNRLALLSPLIHSSMVLDHFPPRYEHALHRLDE